MSNQCPVVLVHGLLGFGPKELGPLNYWGTAFKVPSPLPRYEASVGPLSSAHDRACELAAQIKGARVDYGEEHARRDSASTSAAKVSSPIGVSAARCILSGTA